MRRVITLDNAGGELDRWTVPDDRDIADLLLSVIESGLELNVGDVIRVIEVPS